MELCRDSRWQFFDSDQVYVFTIVGLWWHGTGSRAEVVRYELQRDGFQYVKQVEPSKMNELINQGKIKPL